MKGSYHFSVRSKRNLFEFEIKRNITVIKGDSATGKTTLLHMLYEYLRVERQSGYSVVTNAKYYVYMRREAGREWQDALFPLENTVIFIEENNDFVFGKEFANFVKTSGNYFVFVSRSPLKMLPYSIREVYEIATDGRRTDVKEAYHELREMYSNFPVAGHNRLQEVIVEDQNAGFQFFSHVFADSSVRHADGNGNVLQQLKTNVNKDTLAVADGAAFGAMMEDCLEYMESQEGRRIAMWLPESFEYLILKSGVIESKGLNDILESLSDYVDSSEFESWEQYFTWLLTSITEDTPYQYSKRTLNEVYLHERNLKKIVGQFPEAIRKG